MRREPLAPASVGQRRAELADAWTVDWRERIPFIVDSCRDQRVLDLGCVDHSVESLKSPGWLHRHVLEAASSCVGVDYEAEGIDAMRAEGMEAYVADITANPTPELLALPRFDWIVAGEIIEHLACPQALLSFARPLLAPGGRVLITTPNPYALWRNMRGQTRGIWENVDHVCYLFPAGMAEMAARTGMRVVTSTTIHHKTPRDVVTASTRSHFERIVRRLLRPHDPPLRDGPAEPYYALSLPEVAVFLTRRRFGWLGETAVYVLVSQDDIPP